MKISKEDKLEISKRLYRCEFMFDPGAHHEFDMGYGVAIRHIRSILDIELTQEQKKEWSEEIVNQYTK